MHKEPRVIAACVCRWQKCNSYVRRNHKRWMLIILAAFITYLLEVMIYCAAASWALICMTSWSALDLRSGIRSNPSARFLPKLRSRILSASSSWEMVTKPLLRDIQNGTTAAITQKVFYNLEKIPNFQFHRCRFAFISSILFFCFLWGRFRPKADT